MSAEKVHSMYGSYFRNLPDERRVFYPHGLFGRTGYLVETAAQEARLKKYLFYYLASGCVFGLLVGAFGAPFLFRAGLFGLSVGVVVVLVCCWLYGKLFFLPVVRTMKKIKKANDPLEKCEELGASLHPVFLFGSAGLVYLSAVFCILVFVFTQELFFGLGGLYFSLLGVPLTIAVTFRLSGSHRRPPV